MALMCTAGFAEKILMTIFNTEFFLEVSGLADRILQED